MAPLSINHLYIRKVIEMKQINIDIETYSNTDLTKAGVYKYADDPSFTVLLFGYSVDQGPVKCIQCAKGEKIPAEIIRGLQDPEVMKYAFNASFERVCLGRFIGIHLSPESWRCTMVASLYLGLPGSLAAVGAVLGLEKQKLSEGKELIKYFSVPCKPTKANGMRTRNRPEHAPEKWDAFVRYNIRDVETEMGIAGKISRFPVPEDVWKQYVLDQEINDRGVAIDMTLAQKAVQCDEECRTRYLARAKLLTGLENPNSPIQLKEWLQSKGADIESLAKKEVRDLLETADGDVKEVLELRQLLSKSSVKKYTAMETCCCSDGRAHGLLQFYGANRTGRWAGRLIQVQNLPQNHISDLEVGRSLIRSGCFEAAEVLYDSVPDLLSQLIRTAFIPKKGCKFIVADFSAVEARALSWMAGEKWRMDVFAQNGDIYCMSASQMFGVPVEKHGVNGELRQKGKIAELACIAEGQLVLTDQGLVPIEKVTTDHLLWDGEAWVKHDGVIYKGIREVITYEGLTATKDHLVWVQGESGPIRFGDAAASGAHLIQTGNGRNAVRLSEEHRDPATTEETVSDKRKARLYDIRNAGRHHRFTVSGKLVHNCGYGGSVGALIAMGALEQGLTEEELRPIVDSWRQANPKIVQFWWDIDKAVVTAVKERKPTRVKCFSFRYESGFLIATLPSGRSLYYVKPRIMPNEYDRDSLTYEGVGAAKRWERIESYGPKIVENLTQALCRDLLAEAMQRLTDAGYKIVMHVHDEAVIEAPMDADVNAACEIMSQTPSWAPGLVLNAAGYECAFYQKD